MNTQLAPPAKVATRFPITISAGHLATTIYKTPTKIRGTKYDNFTLCWSLDGQRQRHRFSDLTVARTEGDRIVREKSQATLAVAAISAADRISLEAALVELAQAEGTSNTTPGRLMEIVRAYSAARALLPKGAALAEAA